MSNTAGSLAEVTRRSSAAYFQAQQQVIQDSIKNTGFDHTALSIERICCDRHFGGMPIEDVVALVRKHAPEYFV